MKMAQRDEMKEKQRLKKEGIAPDADLDTDPDGGGHEEGGEVEELDDGDLFGSDDQVGPGMPMVIG